IEPARIYARSAWSSTRDCKTIGPQRLVRRRLAFAAARGHISPMFIQTEATPNPEVLKFLPGKAVLGEGTRDFRSPEEAAVSPLAAEIFEITGVTRVFFGPDFITVGKHAAVDWPHLKAPILAVVMD